MPYMLLKHSVPKSKTTSLQVSEDYMKSVVEKLFFERVYGTKGNEKAAEIVKAEFHKVMKSGFGTYIVGKTNNVVAGDPLGRIIIGAHYDSEDGTIGADDNLSAVAVMMEVMRYFGAKRPGIRYVAFNGEEQGLLGSTEFVSHVLNNSYSENPDIKQAHILEMVGYCSQEPNSQRNPMPLVECPTVGNFLGLVGNDDALIDQIIDNGGFIETPVLGIAIPKTMSNKEILKYSPHLLRSDHAPFWQHKIPAVMWTDTSEFRNPHYHKMTDTPDTLDYGFMADTAKLLIKTIIRSLEK